MAEKFGCLGGNRYIILALSLCFLSINLGAIITYNATFVSMVHLQSSPLYKNFIENSSVSIEDVDWNSSELPLSQRRFLFGTLHKIFGFAGGYLGAIAAVIPASQLIRRFGCHRLMTISGALATVLVSITPVVISWSFPCFVLLRVLQGFTLAPLFTVAGCVVNEWSTMNERGLFIGVLSAHVEAGAVFVMPASGAVAGTAGWPCVFYLIGFLLGVLTIMWGIYYRDQAVDHPFVKEQEWKKISFGKKLGDIERTNTPFRKILASAVIWSVWLAVIGNFLVSQFAVAFAPIYLNKVLGLEPSEAGVLTLIPVACLLVIKFCTGFFSDRIQFVSELSKIRTFNTIALLGSAVFFIVLSCSDPGDNMVTDVVLLSIPMILLGFSSGGYSKCAIVVSGKYSPFVMAIVQIMACSSMMAGSLIVPTLTPNDSLREWQRVFIVYGLVLACSNTVFVIFASAEPAKWTHQVGERSVMDSVMGANGKHQKSNSESTSSQYTS